MRRSARERSLILRRWNRRHELDAALSPGRFRKGRRPEGCPRPCASCRGKKDHPLRRQMFSDLSLHEWIEELTCFSNG